MFLFKPSAILSELERLATDVVSACRSALEHDSADLDFLRLEREACVFAMERWQPGPDALQCLNVGRGVDLSIRELAGAVAAATGYQGEIHGDTSKADGTPMKQLEVRRLAGLGWRARIQLAQGIGDTVNYYCKRLVRGLVRL